MSTYSLVHLGDTDLLTGLTRLLGTERQTTAALLAHLAEVDARRLYLPAACSSMHGYCVQQLGLAEDAAFKRIHAARAARRFPVLFDAIADGRLHLSAVVMLAPHLTDANVAELVARASHRSKADLARLLAEHAPRPDLPTVLTPVPAPIADEHAPAPVVAATPPPVLRPLSPQRFALQVTIDEATHDKLRRAQALLRHRTPSGDLAEVVDRALDALLATLERQKFAATDRPRRRRAAARGRAPRHIPNEVKRAVHERDGSQCTFVSDDGLRCTERGFLEFDHVEPVARGGGATTASIRLLCRAHNQYEAERAFGRAFMEGKRPAAVASPMEADALLALRGLGVKAADARSALAQTASPQLTSLEAWLRAALAVLYTRAPGRAAVVAPQRAA
jgi:hypothetical protein